MQWTVWARWLKPGVLTLPPSALMHIYPGSFCQCCRKLILTTVRGRFLSHHMANLVHLAPRGLSFPRRLRVSWAQCMPTPPPPPHSLPSLMHLYAALKSRGLMTGDHSTYLRCSCGYSNEPSSVDGVRDNESILVSPLLVCDSRIYLVDCIMVPKSPWFAGITFQQTQIPPHACRGKCLFIYPFVISIVILWCCCINWTASTAQQFKAQWIYYKESVMETLLNGLTNQPLLRGGPHNNVTQSH